ncbi:response regulator transcription factor [Streptomyces griseiscabiei]|uniref:response regulator transcription factor n=1 Tax=Streptomyces griseiscabiei TaxID=2993540 RepID=UPI000A3A8254|nr:response regulator transcription factor [Streptomyces griseiscabiei]
MEPAREPATEPATDKPSAPRVLVVDDQTLIRTGFRLILTARGIDVVGEAADGAEAVTMARELEPDVVLMDIRMPNMDGLEATRRILDRAPGCRVLILTTFGRPGYLRRAMDAGAAGFLVKDGPVEELARAIRRVLTGETVVDPALATAALSAGPNPLTDRERDTLNASADGATVADIAARLRLSESTVRNYLSSAIGKTGTRNRMEALREARQQGWL